MIYKDQGWEIKPLQTAIDLQRFSADGTQVELISIKSTRAATLSGINKNLTDFGTIIATGLNGATVTQKALLIVCPEGHVPSNIIQIKALCDNRGIDFKFFILKK